MELRPIGTIERRGDEVWLQVDEPYRPALAEVHRFSHINVLWWASGHDNESSRSIMQTELPYAPGVQAGVFACRAEYRPNPIALTTCRILEVDEAEGIVTVTNIDAYDGSPILDLKAYFPVLDRVENARLPKWLGFFPRSMPAEGIGIME